MNSSASSGWVTEKNKLWLALIVGVFATVAYKLAGEVSMRLNPSALPLSALDLAVPVVPWTVWIYISVYLTYFASVLLQRDLTTVGRFYIAYVIGYGLSMFFFMAYPTTFPRDLYPVPDSAGLSGAALEFFRSTDRPTNCLPSMHVASCVMLTLPFYKRRQWVFWGFCLWTLAISVATLTTKQHYAIDVVSGGLFGALCHYVAPRLERLRERQAMGPGSSTPPAAG
jgi:membrane-associated phospholipid phosphatase